MSPYLSEILKLSIPERILLVEAIWDSIAGEGDKKNSYQLSEDQIKVLEDELKEYAKRPEEGSSWEDVKKRILGKK